MILELKKTVFKNMILISACMTLFYSIAVMMTALAPITIVHLLDNNSFSGLTPAIFLLSASLIAFPAGKIIDKIGLMPMVAIGFVMGSIGNILIAFSVYIENIFINIFGFILTGMASGIIMLSRMAGIDMFPPEKRGQGVGLILMGAVVGGLIGPFIFMPVFSSISDDGQSIIFAWLIGAFFMGIGCVVALFVKPDPKKIALEYSKNLNTANIANQIASNLTSLLRKPTMPSTLITAIMCHALMVSLMSLMGYIMSHNHHAKDTILFTIGIHFVGMFGLALITGKLIDRFGFRIILVCGLLLTMTSFATLPFSNNKFHFLFIMFILGLGWNMSFISATTRMASLVPPNERGKIMGFNDLIAGMIGAILSLLGGFAFSKFGILPISGVGTALTIIALLSIIYSYLNS